MAPEAVSLIWLVTAKKEAPARLHEGTVEIPGLEATLSHLRGEAAENDSQEETRSRNKCLFISL